MTRWSKFEHCCGTQYTPRYSVLKQQKNRHTSSVLYTFIIMAWCNIYQTKTLLTKLGLTGVMGKRLLNAAIIAAGFNAFNIISSAS